MSRLKTLLVLAALFVGLLPASAGARGIDVVWAMYGTPQTGHVCNARAAIASMCNGHSQCIVDVRNVNLCGDPDFMAVKQVAIKYHCGRAVYSTSANEYYLSNLACR